MKKRGITLIEVLIAMVLLTIMMVSFSNIYIFAMKTYGEQFAQTRLNSEAQTIIDRISNDVNLAQSVEDTYLSYQTNSTTLILKIPAINESQDFIYANGIIVYDHFVYYITDSTLYRATYAVNSSARYSQNNQIKNLSTHVNSLSFAYEPDMIAPGSIKTNITLTQATGKVTTHVALQGKARFRNNL